MIEVNGLVKRFDGFAALDGAALSVPAGSVYGLVGPNGAGKSTLIRHLTGIFPTRRSSDLVLLPSVLHSGYDALLPRILSRFFHGAV